MSEPYETLENGNTRVSIYWDETGDEIGNPRDADNLGVMLCCNHRSYELGDAPSWLSEHMPEYAEAERAFQHYGERGKLRCFPRWARSFLGATHVLPLYLLDHSGLSMSTSTFPMDPGGWDSGLLGFIFDTKRTREDVSGTPPELVEEVLVSEVEQYDMYLRGEVFYAVTETRVPADVARGAGKLPEFHDEWHEVDTIYGLLGSEWALQYAKEIMEEAQ